MDIWHILFSTDRFSKVHESGLYDDMISDTAAVTDKVQAGKFYEYFLGIPEYHTTWYNNQHLVPF